MKYATDNPSEAREAWDYLAKLTGQHAVVEIKKVSPGRTIPQNSYLHLILAAFGVETGYTLDESKTLYKREVNPDLYVYQKNEKRFLKSSADLTKEEMQKSIDRFLSYASSNGVELPFSGDMELLRHMENEIERNSKYL
jgi:hypothetical protein